jgi:hypothetical protein
MRYYDNCFILIPEPRKRFQHFLFTLRIQ